MLIITSDAINKQMQSSSSQQRKKKKNYTPTIKKILQNTFFFSVRINETVYREISF